MIENTSIPQAAKTRANFKEILDGQPTQLWTGNGYHFIQPQFAIVLEKVEMFKEFDQASRKFLHFEEPKISDKKADPTHCRTVSFNNCWLRVPGSLNSNQVRFNENGEIIDIPPEAEVRVIHYRTGWGKPIHKAIIATVLYLAAGSNGEGYR